MGPQASSAQRTPKLVGLKPIIGQTTSTVARTGMKLMGLRPQGQGSSFSPSRPLFFPHLPPAPCSTFPTGTQSCQPVPPAASATALSTMSAAQGLLADVPTLRILVGRLQGRRGLLRSLPYPTRRHLRAASCAAARGGEGGTISVRRGGNQASRGGCSTDRMPRRSAVPCNLLVWLGQGI